MLNILLFCATYLSGMIMALASNPIWAFVLYQAVYFYNPQARWWGANVPDLSYSFFVVILMATLLITGFQKYANNNPLNVPQFRWLYALLALYGISSLYAIFPELHIVALTDYCKMIATLTVAFMLCTEKKHIDYMNYGFIYGATYLGFMAYQVGRNSGGRVQGIGTVDAPDANGTAAAICPAIVLAVFYFWKSKSKLQRAAFVIALAFIVNAIILINSRGAFLGVAVSMLYFFGFMIFSKFQQENQRRIVAYLLCLAAIGGTVLIDEAFVERMLTIKETEVSYEKETGASRTIFWLAAIDMAKDYPFGQGYRGFNHHSPDYLPPDMDTGSSRNRTVHSTWFEALSEIGYPGLVCFMLLLASCFRTAKQIKHLAFKERNHELYFKLVAMEAALLAFIVAMTFLNRLRAEILHWLILFTAVAYNLYVAQTRQQQHNR